MKVNKEIFRAYDLRGIVDKDLNPEIVEHIGKVCGTYLKRHNISKAVVGRDCRETSPEYAQAVTRGLRWAGIDVTDIGMVLIGMFYWAQYPLKSKGGVFITASHNPAEYNGMKIAVDYSETTVSEQMEELYKMTAKDDIKKGKKEGSYKQKDIRDDYFKDIKRRFKNLKDKKFKVLIDPSNATAGAIVPDLLKKIGYDVVEKNCEIKPNFPLNTPDPTETVVAERMSKEVLESRADVGFSYDADGDRIGIVDEKGTIIWNDVLLALLAADVLEHHQGATIMFNTLCSKLVQETIQKHGGKPFMWRTGHSFLKKKNQEVGAAFIGELSGHFFFSKDFYNHDDGFYTALRLLDYLARTKQTLSKALSKLPQYISSPEIKIGCPDNLKVGLMKKIGVKLRKDYPDAEVIDDERAGDGVRLELPDSMFVVRYSQNGPYLTVKFEARDKKQFDKLRKYILNLLKSYKEVDWSFGVNVESLEK